MTFTTRLKEEISKQDFNEIESRWIIDSFLKYNSSFKKDRMIITLENASVARMIYKLLRKIYGISPKIIIRIQKRFRVKQIYIIEIYEKLSLIKSNIDGIPLLDSDEEKMAYLTGSFLGVGNVSNPKTSGYHLEYILDDLKSSKFIEGIANYFNLNAKVTKRGKKYITYIKMSESISDLIKMFKAIDSLFEFEDTRIYRDHKNMVNRLNNCEIANQEKTIRSAMNQIEDIKYLEDHDLVNLLEDKVKIVINYRKKYPDVSLQELADIISLETDYKIGKSGINHQFIKIRKMKESNLKAEGKQK